MLEVLISFVMLFLFWNCSTTYKRSAERIIYTNENVEIIGKEAGLPEYLKEIFVSIENNVGYEREFFKPFETKLEYYMSGFGIKMERIFTSNSARIEGRVEELVISTLDELTNIDHQFYKLRITYSLFDENGYFLQKDREIKEYLLVLNTNLYDLKFSLEKLADISARHISEAVKFGWQSDFTKTERYFYTIGGKPYETNNNTNR